MFVLKNYLGTAYIETKSKLRRDDLLSRGWTLVERKSLDKMEPDELKLYAAEHNIDISSAENKTQMIKIIKANKIQN